MTLRAQKVPSVEVLDTLLKGGIVGGRDISQGRTLGLHGKTLVFTAPSGTVTFDDPSGAGLTGNQILAQICSDVTALRAKVVAGQMHILDADYSAAVSLNTAGSTASQLLGLSSAVGSVMAGTKYASIGGSAPALVAFQPSPFKDGIIVITDET